MKRIYIFGASEYGKRAYHELKDKYQVLHFVDNSKAKQGTVLIDGLTVLPPEEIVEGEDSMTVIASSYVHEILDQLEEMGINHYAVYPSLRLNGGQDYTNRELAAAIDKAVLRLYRKYKSMDIGTLPISDYNKCYLKNKSLTNLYQYGRILYFILDARPEAGCFLEYGGGTGLLSLLALELGLPHVYYNDIYAVSCEDARVIAASMGYVREGYIEGDIDKVYAFCEGRHIRFDAVGSYDVIEHIYELASFYKTLKFCLGGKAIVCMESGANPYNPTVRTELVKGHIAAEFLDRERGYGWKERDASGAYFHIRERLVGEYLAELERNLGEAERLALAFRTRGRRVEDIRKAVDKYLKEGELPQLDPYCPYNTCDPYTGNWAEHIIDFHKLQAEMEEMGLPTRLMFEGGPECSPIIRLLSVVSV